MISTKFLIDNLTNENDKLNYFNNKNKNYNIQNNNNNNIYMNTSTRKQKKISRLFVNKLNKFSSVKMLNNNNSTSDENDSNYATHNKKSLQISLSQPVISSNNNNNNNVFEQTSGSKKNNIITKEIKSVLLSLATILIYYCFSICLTFYNRYLFVTYKYPLSITIIHLIFKFLASTLIRNVADFFAYCKKKFKHKQSESINSNHYENKRVVLDWHTYFNRIVPTAVASAADIGLSNWSLQYITVTLYTMSKSTVILFIFFFSILFKLEKWVSFRIFY